MSERKTLRHDMAHMLRVQALRKAKLCSERKTNSYAVSLGVKMRIPHTQDLVPYMTYAVSQSIKSNSRSIKRLAKFLRSLYASQEFSA